MTALLPSFFIAGFEASTMRRADGRRNDLVAATAHEELAAADYARLRSVGILVAREGAAWHRIQPRPGSFDPSSALGRLRAAKAAGIQLIWDLCHFGWPDDVDPFREDFPERLATFAGAFARLVRDESDGVPWYVPVNEPSFVAWAGGDVGYLNPFARARGDELKLQLVRAALAASAAVREVDPRARICHVDPAIHIVPAPDDPESEARVARHNEAQFEAWDRLGGRLEDDLGGSDAELDVIGVNFYDRNEWVDGGPVLRPGQPGHRPLRDLLADIHQRYRRPIIVAETGTEGEARVPWLRSVCEEVAAARGAGVQVEGICVYPVLDHPGWDDDRHVQVGLWGYPEPDGHRPEYAPLVDEVRAQAARFDEPVIDPSGAERAGSGSGRPPTRRTPAPLLRPRTDPRGLRICLVTDSRDPSGVGRLMLTLGRGLANRGHLVALATPAAIDSRWLLEAAREAGLHAWSLPDASPWAQAAALEGWLRASPVDVVNVHAGIGWEGHHAVSAARRSGAAIVRTDHLPFLLTKERDRREFFDALPQLDSLIAVSRGVGQSLVDAGVARELVHVARNGIDEPSSNRRRDEVRGGLGVALDAPLVASVGRLTPQKGYDVLLEALAAAAAFMPQLCAVIVGRGPLERILEASVESLGLADVVRFIPAWPDVPSLIAASDALVLASRFEGLPLVALEAMGMSRPVVGTSVCGTEEAIVDGVTGRLVASEDAVALGHAIYEVVADPGLAAGLGIAGRRRFEAEFTAERMVAEVEDVYRGVLREKALPDAALKIAPAVADADVGDADVGDADVAEADVVETDAEPVLTR